MSPEDVGLAALLRPIVIVALLGVVYVAVRLGARYLPGCELKRICMMTMDRANQRQASKDLPRQ